jgi:peptidoglycan-associated lipoprotein
LPIAASVLGVMLLAGAAWYFTSGQSESPQPVAEATPVATETKAEPLPAPIAEPVAKPLPAPLPERVGFALDDSKLGDNARMSLDQWAERMTSDKSLSVQIDGHCDERGTKAYNLRLGERRAVAVKHYLLNKGVEAQRMSTMSYGESRPLAKGRGESAWSRNRRVEMHSSSSAISQR